MPVDSFPVRWVGTSAVITVPVELDLTISDEFREQLLSLINMGAKVLVIDMSATTFCDSAGVNAVVRAYRRAAAVGSRLRMVITSPAVRRVYSLTEVDRIIPVSPALEEALGSADGERDTGQRAGRDGGGAGMSEASSSGGTG